MIVMAIACLRLCR